MTGPLTDDEVDKLRQGRWPQTDEELSQLLTAAARLGQSVERERCVSMCDEINLLACYASEENTEARYAALLRIGEIVRQYAADIGRKT